MQVKLTPLSRNDGRLHPRRSVRLKARFEAPAGALEAFVADLSETGCRLSGVDTIDEGDAFLIKLPGLEARPCRVAWVDRQEVGCEFETPLYRAECELVRAQSEVTARRVAGAGFGRRLLNLAGIGGGGRNGR